MTSSRSPGVERFIDTPIKHYSSGMQVRLGFAIAAHLEPEILIVDEVLAVGDEEFQRRCLEKIGDVAAKGLAILLVSHDLAAVRSRCDVAHLFDAGQLTASGPPQEIVDTYVAQVCSTKDRTCGGNAVASGRRRSHTLEPGAPCSILIDIEAAVRLRARANLTLQIRRDAFPCGKDRSPETSVPGGYEIRFDIEALALAAGSYELSLALVADGGLRTTVALESSARRPSRTSPAGRSSPRATPGGSRSAERRVPLEQAFGERSERRHRHPPDVGPAARTLAQRVDELGRPSRE